MKGKAHTGKPAMPEAKTKQVDPKVFSSRKSTPKKSNNDVTPAGMRPKGKMGSKKLDNIRI